MRRLIGFLVVGLATLSLGWAVAQERRSGVTTEAHAHQGISGGGQDDEGADDEGSDEPQALVERFESDPLARTDVLVRGEALERLSWAADEPVFPGDAAGSLAARFDATAPAGLFGFPLPQSYDESTEVTVAAAFVIRSGGFQADPDGFFQISFGLWNSATTGLDRTGDFADFATDSFELIGLDYFPNVSPFFGGPFVSPGVFGRAAIDDPAFGTSGAFANFTGLFDLEVGLPLDVPLLAVLEHRPDIDALVVQVYRIEDADHVLPIQSAVGIVPLQLLSLRRYEVDAVGPLLWHDGFGGPVPSVTATLDFHALVVVPGLVGRPEELLALEVE